MSEEQLVFDIEAMLHESAVESAPEWHGERYPKLMLVVGAPVITECRPYGTRHVPGRYPWDGYDISHTAVDPDRIIEGAKPVRRTRDLPLELDRLAAAGGWPR